MWKEYPVYQRENGTFVITYNDMPYHVTETDDVLYGEVTAYAGEHPEQVTAEPAYTETLTEEQKAASVRSRRNRRLSACDYLMMPDYPLSEAARAAWTTYRQALRDITGQEGFPWAGGGTEDTDCPWPVEPAALADSAGAEGGAA